MCEPIYIRGTFLHIVVRATDDRSLRRTVSAPALLGTANNTRHTVFVGGLHRYTDETDLFEFMTKFGFVKQMRIVRYPRPPYASKGFAVVEFLFAPDPMVFKGGWVLDGRMLRIAMFDPCKACRRHEDT
jgi:hypothetical protein